MRHMVGEQSQGSTVPLPPSSVACNVPGPERIVNKYSPKFHRAVKETNCCISLLSLLM